MIKWVITRKNSIKLVKVKDHNDDFYLGSDFSFYLKSKSFDSEQEAKEFLIGWASKKIKILKSNLISLERLIADMETFNEG